MEAQIDLDYTKCMEGFQMTKFYDDAFKYECVQQVVKEGKTIKEVQDTFNLGQGTLNNWIKNYSGTVSQSEKKSNDEHQRLLKEVKELKKENDFLKKAAAFFAKNLPY